MSNSVCEIVEGWLKENGFEGLQNDECGCTLDDLMNCYEPGRECEAAYVFRCDKCIKREDCPDTISDYDWICSTTKEYCIPKYGDHND